MSKELFFEMREAESFDFTSTKKSIIEQGEAFVKVIKNEGLVDKHELLSKAVRLGEFTNTVINELKNDMTEKYVGYGIEVIPVSGRKLPQYQMDDVYSDLLQKLKEREELLKAALNCSGKLYDSDGIEVPKVAVKYSKDSLQIKF